MSVITFLLPNVQLSPEHVERGLAALERIAESLERLAPSPAEVALDYTSTSLRPSTAEDFHLYTDREADADFLAREGLQPDDTRAESPVFSLAHTDEFGGSMADEEAEGDDGDDDFGLNPNGPDGPAPISR